MTDLNKLAEQIAKNLSKPQREQINRDEIGGAFSMRTVRALEQKGLFAFSADSPNGRCGSMRITALGLLVRTHAAKGDGA